jgi:hypothetical protein
MYLFVRRSKSALLLIILGFAINQVYAQYEIKKYTLNNAGTTLKTGEYQLSATMGQTDSGQNLAAGSYSLSGGFWQQNNDLIFKNGIE